jgi:hypothetical protein
MIPLEDDIVDALRLPPFDDEIAEELVLRTNPELEVFDEEESEPHVIVPQSAGGVRLTDQVRRMLEVFSEPNPAGCASHGEWAESSEYLRRLLGARILLRHEVNCLITGCGRSGTAYSSRLLGELGADVLHETMGLDGIASWLLAVDADSAPWGPVRSQFHYRTVLHQVRHPLAAIASAQTFQPESWEYIATHIPCGLEEPLLLRCAKYWHYWNLEAERIAAWTYRLEELPAVFDRFCQATRCLPDRSCLEAVSTAANSRKAQYREIGWGELARLDPRLTDKIKEQAARYGYRV